MSRSKKSRKPGVGSSGLPKPKVDKKTLAQMSDKRPKKKNGKTAGNRQQEAKTNKGEPQQNAQARDPRLGSKKPIVLVKESAKQPATLTNKPKKEKPIAAIRKVEPSDSLQQRLIAIEEDEYLLAIIAKQEDEIVLSEEEIEYFNNLMDEHAKISDILGLDEEESDEEKPRNDLSEDDLWNKLDSSDFSEFTNDIDE